MTTELQEIAIPEEKPLLLGQLDPTKEAEIAARILLDQGQEHNIETPYGLVHVTIHGSPKSNRPAIVTYHDVGLNHKSCFGPLFRFEEMQEITKNFVVCHIDAPGQEEGAAAFPLGYRYPSMDQLAEMIPCILQYFNFRRIIGMGVGAGAYVLSRYTLTFPDSVDGLVLINIDAFAKGWMDWTVEKLATLTSSLTEKILGHLFSQEELYAGTELVKTYKEIISQTPNLYNIELFWKIYNSRRDLNIERGSTLKCPVMLVVGDQAPYEEAVVECNAKMDPTQTSFLKMADSGGLPQLRQPSKMAEAFKYFVQGMGYIPSACMTRLSRSRTTSLSSSYSMDGNRSRSRTLSQGSEAAQPASTPPQTTDASC
ncbi:protein NDRG2-like isoform X1 [Acipenser ruthenus]|uniref:protein NDRG2-like isoform X1 n=1 Tax=Acipenser ruthenus TaxID=7906 RepID=UPI00145AFF9F|nr:protein NDRG2-like isoform X1 [Acipenser ruthenus]XP_058868400.1 protein NDRG2-like isoform X1 [Acipenser ruthenus]